MPRSTSRLVCFCELQWNHTSFSISKLPRNKQYLTKKFSQSCITHNHSSSHITHYRLNLFRLWFQSCKAGMRLPTYAPSATSPVMYFLKWQGQASGWDHCFQLHLVFWHCNMGDRNGNRPTKNSATSAHKFSSRHTHTCLTALCQGLPRWPGTRNVKTNLDFTEAREERVAVTSAAPYASLHLAPDRQPCQHTTTQFFTGQMPFLLPNQQRQSRTVEKKGPWSMAKKDSSKMAIKWTWSCSPQGSPGNIHLVIARTVFTCQSSLCQ